MNDKERDLITALYAAQATTATLLAHIITVISPVQHQQIAELFEAEAKRIPEDSPGADMARTTLLQIATNIRSSTPGGESWADLLARLRS